MWLNFRFRLKRNTEEPLKAQVVRQISEFIKSAKLKPGAALASTQSLGAQLGISRETVRRAYVRLREAKLIEREEKRGYQVRASNARQFPAVKTPPATKAHPVTKATRPRPAKSTSAACSSRILVFTLLREMKHIVAIVHPSVRLKRCAGSRLFHPIGVRCLSAETSMATVFIVIVAVGEELSL